MSENLVIVESPAKARTIQKFLGDGYVVKPSFGHIRDLQEKQLSIDVEHGFKPEYVIPDDKKKVIADLKKLSDKAKTVWLASDEDREGEAISWHLVDTLGLPPEKTRRIVFHEITKDAVSALSVKKPENGRVAGKLIVAARRSDKPKCARCWNCSDTVGLNSEYPDVCARCADVLKNQA